jgi:hypothetical protein
LDRISWAQNDFSTQNRERSQENQGAQKSEA